MKKIKNFMIIIILIIIVLIIAIILNNQNSKKLKEGEDPEEEIEITNEIESVSNRSRFSTIESCIQQYYDCLNSKSDSYYIQNDDGTTRQIVSNEEINQIKLNLLSEEYIEKNNISINNINKYVQTIDEKVIVTALQMKELIGNTINKYVVYGYIINLDYKVIDDFYIFVNLDTENQTFSIEPINQEYNNIDEIKFENENKTIESNDDNNYIEDILDYEESAKKYFLTYKKIILSSPKLLYNYLNEEYKNTRFGSLQKFEEYVEKNVEGIKESRLEQYLVNENEAYTQFVCKDQYGSMYIFNAELPMQFTLELDTYTIITDNFKSTYDSSENRRKVMMNIDKWIQMLNNRDYTAAYNLLDGTFRNEKFGSEEKFEQYMRENYPLHYKVEFGQFTDENNTYIQNIILTDITKEDDDSEDENKIQTNIIMQLKENYNFVMSFGIE